jgi:hypothetical protein
MMDNVVVIKNGHNISKNKHHTSSTTAASSLIPYDPLLVILLYINLFVVEVDVVVIRDVNALGCPC